MNDEQKLRFIHFHHILEANIVALMRQARELHIANYEQHMYMCLFDWAIAKDQRDQHYALASEDEFWDALDLKEGLA